MSIIYGTSRALRVFAGAVLLTTTVAFGAQAETADIIPLDAHWTDSWSASEQPDWPRDFWVVNGLPRALQNQTLRQTARISVGGVRARVEISNLFGTTPLIVGAAHIAKPAKDGGIDKATDTVLTFGGAAGITIPPGASVWSDPADFATEDLDSVAVSLFFPETAPTTTFHNDGRQEAFISGAGDFTSAERFDARSTTQSRLFLSGISVETETAVPEIVMFGDSITDGDGTTRGANTRLPDQLANRFVAEGIEAAVLNEGISGERVLHDGLGTSALERFDRDVLSHPNVEAVVFLMGINDIGWPGTPLTAPSEPLPSAEDIIQGYRQIIDSAHTHGIRIIGATMTPFSGAFSGGALEAFNNPEKENIRLAVNDWIRTSGAFDGVVDFDAVVGDPQAPDRIAPQFDSGDHLHPNDAGYKAMAAAIDPKMLGLKTGASSRPD